MFILIYMFFEIELHSHSIDISLLIKRISAIAYSLIFKQQYKLIQLFLILEIIMFILLHRQGFFLMLL